MRLYALLFAAILMTLLTGGAAAAQEPPASPASAEPSAQSSGGTTAPPSAQDAAQLNLPVSLDRIRKALEQQPVRPLLKLPDQPTFRIEVRERNRLQELLATLDFKSGPTPAGGLYAAEMRRIMFPSVSNPLAQPYAAFNQPELLTIIIENLVGKYLIGKAFSAITAAERERAEAAAREEVRQTIAQYCAGQPNGGAGIKICSTPAP
ncbi:MAG: hypothetical protein Q7J25_07325 [Vicinamibacterales bacterium]|nr:hypothetical protein [Vicinamibacterales bacterium]